MENRYRMLSDDKARGEHEARLRLDRGCDEISDSRRTLEELKFLIAEKTKIGCNLIDEHQRCKRALDEKAYEAARLKEEVCCKNEQVRHDHESLNAVQADVEQVKTQRAEMCREILRLRQCTDKKCHEAHHQDEVLKKLSADCARTEDRIADLNQIIDVRNHEISCKKHALDECTLDLSRTRECNSKTGTDVAALKRETDRVNHECHDINRELSCTEKRNSDLTHRIGNAEKALNNLEHGLCDVKKDIDCQRNQNTNARRLNEDLHHEREAIGRHASVLEHQNTDLSKELDHFVHTDEVLRH